MNTSAEKNLYIRKTELTFENWADLLEYTSESEISIKKSEITKLPLEKRTTNALEVMRREAIAGGDPLLAALTAKILERPLKDKELLELYRKMMLNGNVKGFFHLGTNFSNLETRILFHTTMTIAVCRAKRSSSEFPIPALHLTTWHTTYKRELRKLITKPKFVKLQQNHFPSVQFLLLSPQELDRFAAVLYTAEK